jgi:hypothetical protein
MLSQDTINLLFTGAGALAGWLFKVIWDSVQTLQEDLRDIEKDLHVNYVRNDELNRRLDRIDDILNQIFNELKSKADK